jgi:hypothetical protein
MLHWYVSFLIPKIPGTQAPTSPLVSVQAEQARQDAATAAEKDAIKGGRASTIQGGNDIAYAQAGSSLLRSKNGASRSMGY